MEGINSLSKRPRNIKQVGKVLGLKSLHEGWGSVFSSC